MRRATYLLLGSASLALSLAAGSASAADPKFLGYLSNQSGQIWAYPDGGGQWCREEVALSVLLTAQMTYAQVEKGLHTVGTQLAKECKTAVTAKVAAYNSDRSLAGPSFSIRKDNNWLVAAAAPPAPTALPQTAATQPAAPTAPAAPAPQADAPVQLTPAPIAPPSQQVAAPAPAPQAQIEAPQPASPPAQAEANQPPPLQRDRNYQGAMLRAIHDNPALAQDNGTLRLWAAYRFESEYRQFQNQEFKLQPLLERAKADLADTLAHADTDHVTLVLNTQFGAYDFNTKRFPVTLGLQQISTGKPCCFQGGPPQSFVVKLSDADAISGLPMAPEEAQAFTERRTRYGFTNRSISVAVTIKLDHTGFQSDGFGNAVALGSVDGVGFYTDERLNEALYRVGPEEFEKWRVAKAAEKAALAQAQADREAELRRQQMVAQRDQNVRALSGAAESTKLANFISDGDLNFYTRLNNLRGARTTALVSAKPVSVAMLVQMDSSGRDKVDTKWPGHLQVSVPEGQVKLESSGWYLVAGELTVPDGGALPAAQLTARNVYACTQPKCVDATDAAAIVDRKMAAVRGNR